MKKVLITGASGSLGSRLVKHFTDAGHPVLGLDVTEPGPDGGQEPLFRFERCDLREPKDIEACLEGVFSGFGVPDIVINNAGVIRNATLLRLENGVLEKHDFGAWREVIDVTLSAAFYVTACCAQAMARSAKRGVFINLGSICAAGNLGQAAYSAAKAGVNALTVAAAKELGPLGIRVAAIAPGYLDTPSTRAHVPAEILDQIRKRTPTRKLGSVDDLLRAVDFIVSTASFNGKILELDGGLTL